MADTITFTVTVGVTADRFPVNVTAQEASRVEVTAVPTGLDDDFDIDFYALGFNDPGATELTNPVLSTVSLSNSNTRITKSGAFTGSFLVGASSGTATTGTVVLTMVFYS